MLRQDQQGFENMEMRILELNPGYATAHQWYAELLAAVGRMEESISAARKAEELDPLSPAMPFAVGGAYMAARQWEPAEAYHLKALEMEPELAIASALALALALALA